MTDTHTVVFTTDVKPDLKLYFPRLGRTLRFTDGRLATSDPGEIDALRKHPDIDEPGEDTHDRPAKNANREEWNGYAASVGINPDELSSKDDVIAAVDAAQSPPGD